MPSLSWLRQKNLFDNYGMGDYMPGEMGNAPYQNLFKESQPTPPNPFGSIDFGAPQDFASQIPDLTDPSPTEQAPTSPQLDLFQKMNELYKPTTTATDRFNKLLDSAPTMDDNPSWQRKLVAGGIGLDARQRVGTPGQELTARGNPIPAMEGVMQAPYLRDMADWTAKAGPYSQAAQQENTANVNERQLIGQMAQYQTQTDRYEAQNKIQEEKNRISEIRALAYARKAGGWTFDFSTPTIWATSPEGQLVNMGKTEEMAEADRIALQNKGRVEAYAALGQNQINTANAREAGVYQDSKGNLFHYDPNGVNRANMGITSLTPGGPAYPSGQVTPIDRGPSAGAGSGANNREVENAKFRREANMYPRSAERWLVRPDTVNGDWSFGPPPEPIDAWYSPSTWGGGPQYDPTEVKEYNDMRVRLGYPEWQPGTTPQQPPTQQSPPQQQPPANVPPQQPPAQQQAPPIAQQAPRQVAPVNAPMPQNVYAPQPPPGTLPPDTGAPPAFMRDPTQSQIGQDIKGAFTPPPITGAPNIYTPKSPQEYFGGGQQPPPQQPQAPQGTLPQPTLQGSGSKLTVMDPKTGRQGTIDNTPQEIEIAKRAGLLIEYR